MKRILLFVLILPQFLFSQEEEKTEKGVSHNPEFYLYLNHHSNFGDNFLSEANKPNFLGIGLQLNFLKIYDFKIGIGGGFMKYDITDITLAGNIKSTFHYSVFMKIQYQLNIYENWSVEPYAAIGATRIQQKSGSRNFDDFYGTSFYLGNNFIYKLTDHLSIFCGVNYNFTKFNVKTAKSYEDFFQKSNQVQIALGIIISTGKN